MSARVFNVPSTAPPAVPVLCPSPGLDAPPQNPESTVRLHQEFLGDGSRIPFPLDQGNAYGRDDRAALSAAAQVPPAVVEAPARVSASASFVSVGAQVPPAVAEGPSLVLDSSSMVSVSAQVPPVVVGAPAQTAMVGNRLRARFAVPPVAGSSTPEPAEEEDDNVASVVSNPTVVDKTLAQLASFIHDMYPESRPLSAPLLAARCSFESLFVLSDPPESNRPCFDLYPRVEIIGNVRYCASTLAEESKPLSAILPKWRRSHSVADVPDFTTPLAVNPDFSLLAENKAISNKCLGTVSFFELEHLESSAKSLLEANSFSLWLLSGLLSQLKCDGFSPSDSAISSLSTSLSGQTHTAASLPDFGI